MELIEVLPNLSIGVVSVLALVWYANKASQSIENMHKQHTDEIVSMHKSQMSELKEREHAMRAIEQEVRVSITAQLVENTKLFERVVHVLDRR